MDDFAPPISCAACGEEHARADMFGVEPELLCPRCASGIRRRMQVRVRPTHKTHKPFLTRILLGICIVLFIASEYVFKTNLYSEMPIWLERLHQRETIWIGEVWRHLGCIFLHGGVLHLVMNGMALWFLGRVVETVWGPWPMLGIVLVTGVAAAALQWIMSGRSVGISGGLLGLVGFLWALRRDHPVAGMIVDRRFLNGIVMIFVFGFVVNQIGSLGFGIANWAHGGGLAMGFVLGKASLGKQRRLLVPATCLIMVALVVASMYLALGTLHGEKGGSWPRAEVRRSFVESAQRP